MRPLIQAADTAYVSQKQSFTPSYVLLGCFSAVVKFRTCACFTAVVDLFAMHVVRMKNFGG